MGGAVDSLEGARHEHLPSTVGARGSSLRRAVLIGALAGIVASLVMELYAMGASLARETGFFTPAVSAWMGLPVAAATFDSGEPLAGMASKAGWGTWLIEHLLFGLTLGLLLARGRGWPSYAGTPVRQPGWARSG